MIRLLRVLGVMMIGVGAIIIMTYLIEPLRAVKQSAARKPRQPISVYTSHNRRVTGIPA